MFKKGTYRAKRKRRPPPPPPDPEPRRRAYWHSLALDQAEVDCCLLELIPWEGRDLRKLPDEIYHPLLLRINELVVAVCAKEAELNDRPTWLVDRFSLYIWDFLKPWSKNPNVSKGIGDDKDGTLFEKGKV